MMKKTFLAMTIMTAMTGILPLKAECVDCDPYNEPKYVEPITWNHPKYRPDEYERIAYVGLSHDNQCSETVYIIRYEEKKHSKAMGVCMWAHLEREQFDQLFDLGVKLVYYP